MNTIWDARQPLTVRAALDRLDYSTSDGDEPAYTTVMTVMTILWRKGLLSRDRDTQDGNTRAWWYQARITRDVHLAAVIRQVLECAPNPRAVLRHALAASSAQDVPTPETAQPAVRPPAAQARFQPPTWSYR
jgi:predicted transcriptional regulator